MNYLRVEFELSPDLHEFFIAELMDLDFYGFEQFDVHFGDRYQSGGVAKKRRNEIRHGEVALRGCAGGWRSPGLRLVNPQRAGSNPRSYFTPSLISRIEMSKVPPPRS